MSAITIPHPKSARMWRRARRATALPAAVGAVTAVWLVTVKAAGVELHQPAFGSGTPQPLNVGFAAMVAALAALFGWGLLTLLERTSRDAASLWLRTALAALVLSLAGPLSGHGISTDNRLVLVSMHVAAAAAIIASLYRTATTRHEESRT
jgi:predicted lipoprotein